MITLEILRALGATEKNATLYVSALRITANRYNINTPARVAHWLAQLAHESARFSTMVENLNYSAEGLARAWPRRYADSGGKPNALARDIARKPQDIANITYAARLGNGSAGTGDGWKYRGRGLIQITGRDNYLQCGNALGLDLIRSPDLLESPLYAALSAGWFWSRASLNMLADQNDLSGITRRINGGLTGLADRQALYTAAAVELGRT